MLRLTRERVAERYHSLMEVVALSFTKPVERLTFKDWQDQNAMTFFAFWDGAHSKEPSRQTTWRQSFQHFQPQMPRLLTRNILKHPKIPEVYEHTAVYGIHIDIIWHMTYVYITPDVADKIFNRSRAGQLAQENLEAFSELKLEVAIVRGPRQKSIVGSCWQWNGANFFPHFHPQKRK